MRWNNKECRVPQPGDDRSKSRFLLFPKRIGNETRWLERAVWTEKARIVRRPMEGAPEGIPVLIWFEVEWVNG
jgi:hypothetical protein